MSRNVDREKKNQVESLSESDENLVIRDSESDVHIDFMSSSCRSDGAAKESSRPSFYGKTPGNNIITSSPNKNC